MPFGLISGIINAAASMKTAVDNDMNSAANRENQNWINELNWMRTNEIINKNRAWELEDQARLEAREDTGIQRRAKDLEAAGINPLLAGQVGGAAAGTISGKNTSMYTPAEAAITPPKTAPHIDLGDPIERMLEAKKKVAEIKQIEAQTGKTKEDTLTTEIENRYRKDMLKAEIAEKLAQTNNIVEAGKAIMIENNLKLSAEERAKVIHTLEVEQRKQQKILTQAETRLRMAQERGTDIEANNAREYLELEQKKLKAMQEQAIFKALGEGIGAGLKAGTAKK